VEPEISCRTHLKPSPALPLTFDTFKAGSSKASAVSKAPAFSLALAGFRGALQTRERIGDAVMQLL